MEAFAQAVSRLPPFLSSRLLSIPEAQQRQVQEIRLRQGPVMLTLSGKNIPFSPPCTLNDAALQECLYSLCGHSLHTYEQELKQGFFTIAGGHRVGVGGILQYRDGKMDGFKRVLSLNLRIARAPNVRLPQQLETVLKHSRDGILLVGPPCSGKTTLLRSIILALARCGNRVTAVDERCELFAAAPPPNCDLYGECRKADGIWNAIRVMNPQIIACDEIGTEEDARALMGGFAAGVRLIATMHSDSLDAVMQKSCFRALPQELFPILVLLGDDPVGSIREIRREP